MRRYNPLYSSFTVTCSYYPKILRFYLFIIVLNLRLYANSYAMEMFFSTLKESFEGGVIAIMLFFVDLIVTELIFTTLIYFMVKYCMDKSLRESPRPSRGSIKASGIFTLLLAIIMIGGGGYYYNQEILADGSLNE